MKFTHYYTFVTGIRKLLLIISLVPLSLSSQNATSLGGVYNSQNKVLWLKAEDITPDEDGYVSTWPDSSGKGNNAFSEESSHRPEFLSSSSIFNNKPAVRFNNGVNQHMLHINDDESLDGMQELTIISVHRNSTPPADGNIQGIIAKTGSEGHNNSWRFYFRSYSNSSSKVLSMRLNTLGDMSSSYYHYNQAMIQTGIFSGLENYRALHSNGKIISGPQNFGNSSVNRNEGTQVIIGNTFTNGNGWLKGEIAEIIVLRDELNQAQRLIVESMLAFKYDFPLTGTDSYFLDDYKNIAHNHDITGIGGIMTSGFGYQKHSASTGSGGGLYLSEVGNSIDEHDEFVFAAHNDEAHDTTTADLPSDPDLEERWERVWRLERTLDPGQGNGTAIRIGFDFAEANLPVEAESLYVLLYKENSSGQFTRLPISAAPSGNRVSFSVPDEHLQTGYYTIAKSSATVKTWSTVQSGAWENPATWGLASGYPGEDEINDRADNIVINNTHNVTISDENASYSHGDLRINNGGILTLNTTRGHSFNTIRGQGRIVITGDYFPDGEAANFIATNGGTVVYNGNGSFDFTTNREFNNVEIELDTPNDQINLLANFHLNGSLVIKNGVLLINDNSSVARNIRVSENLEVQSSGQLLTGEGNARHQLTLQGNFINDGIVRFSNLTDPLYNMPADDGMVDVIFNKQQKDQVIQANGTTEFYRIEIAKGATDSLFIRSTNPDRFFLMGQNNLDQTTGHWAPNLPNDNALGLLSGIVVIEENIHIPSIKTEHEPGYAGDYLIDQDAQIILRGGILEVPEEITSLGIFGALIIMNGSLKAISTDGVVLRQTGRFEIHDGTAEMRMFRTSVASGVHRGSYIQTGGSVTVSNPGNKGNMNYYNFTLPYPSNSFSMTGGELTVTHPRTTNDPSPSFLGGILISSLPENQNITGGTVNLVLGNHRSFIINSAAPFYNLELSRTSSSDVRFLLAPYPGGVPDGGSSNPPPASEAFPLHVLNNLTLKGGTYPARLDMNGYSAIIEGDILLEEDTRIWGENAFLTVSGSGNNTLEIESPTDVFTIGTLTLDKTGTSDTLFVKRSNINDDSEILLIENMLSTRKGIFSYDTYQISLKGDWELDAPVGSASETGKLVLNGSDLQNITVTDPASPSVIGHLEISNSNGVKLNKNDIQSIYKLTLSDGIFNINKHGITIENEIEGTGYDATKMIATAGGHPNGGLNRLLSGDNTLQFPVGSIVNNTARYTPLSATFSDVQEDVYISVNPVNSELPTLNGDNPDEALRYYWKIRHNDVNTLPMVDEYEFTFDASSLPAPDLQFVPGKVIGQQRDFEDSDNYNESNRTITFNGDGNGFALEQGEYTAGLESKFSGLVRVFYSRSSTNSNAPADWHDTDTWSMESHTGASSDDLPGAGDLVQLGVVSGNPHAVYIDSNVNVAGIGFEEENNQLPILEINDAANTMNLGIVSGTGHLVIKQGVEQATIAGDFEDFVASEDSYITYKVTSNTGNYNIASGFTLYPNLRLEGMPESTARLMLPDNDMLIKGNLEIAHLAGVILHDGAEGNMMVEKNLILGDDGEDVWLLFPESGSSKTIHVQENIYLEGSTNSGITTEGPADDINHFLIAEKDIIHNNGELVFFNGDESATRITLKLTGDSDGIYTRDGGTKPDFYRIIAEKGDNIETTFTFLHDFNLNSSAGNSQKPLELVSGKLILEGSGTDIHLTTGGNDFEIPSKAGLQLKDNVIARASAEDAGITLRGLLKLEENAQLLMAAPSSKAHIQYGASGTARLEISDDALLEVASHIRGFLENDNGVLKYVQDGGTVYAGKNPDLPFNPVHNRPGVLEILNPGSLFHFTGGNLYIVRGHIPDPGHREILYLHPAEVNIHPDATLHLGHQGITNNLYKVTVSSSAVLPNVEVWLGGTVEAEINSNLYIQGNLSINANKILNANQSDLHIYLAGNLENNGNFQINNGTLEMNGEEQLISGNSQTALNDLIINTIQEVALDTDITIYGDLQILEGYLSDLGKDIVLNGNIHNQYGHRSSENTGGFFFSGTNGPQEVSGSGSFGRFIVQNSDGVMLSNSIEIDNMLNLNYGTLYIDNHLLNMGPEATLSPENLEDFNANRMIQLSGDINAQGMRWSVNAPAEYIFPIGVSNKYTPAWVDVTSPQNNANIGIAPIDSRHPNITTTPNLNFYWSVHSEGLSGFTGDLYFQYNDADAQGDQSEYISARLFEESWSRLTFDEVDESGNLVTFPYSTGVNNLSGDYTAGEDIPEVVLRFRTIADGDWPDKDIWENITEGYAADDVPDSGPIGQIAEIAEGDTVYTGQNRKISYRTRIEGNLIVENSSPTHYLGEVTGDGRIILDFPTLPLGNYQNFLTNGTLEYTGNTDYTIDPARFPLSGINNIVFSGHGNRRMPSGSLVVHGNLELLDGVFVDFSYNDVSVQLKGNLSKSSNSILFSGNGSESSTLSFTGSNPQNIEGDFSNQSKLNIVRIDNPAGVSVDGTIEIRNNLELLNGKVNTSETNMLRLLNSAVINGANNQRFINGPLQKQGNTRFIFPVGDNNRMGRIAFRPAGDVWDDQTILQASYHNQTPPNDEQGLAPLVQVSSVEYWSLSTLSNKSENIEGQVELFIEDEEFSGIPFPEEVMVGWYNEPQEHWESQGGTPQGSSPVYVRSNVLDLAETEQLFSFGIDGFSNNPLPIELLSFTAKALNETVRVEWSTASEINNDYFTVERSIDGKQFEVVGYLDGSGTTTTVNSYSLTDLHPHKGVSYYRLKQTDFDGTYEYFDMVAVQTDESRADSPQVTLFPNPVKNGVLNLLLDDFPNEESLDILISDLYGRVISLHQIYTDPSGSANHSINNLQQLKPGIYFVTIQNNNTRIKDKFILR